MNSSQHEDLLRTSNDMERRRQAEAAELATVEARIGALTAERETRYADLATVYLPRMDQDSVQATSRVLDDLRGARERIEGIFEEKRRKRVDLEASMEASAKKKTDLQGELAAFDEKAKDALGRLAALQAKVKADLDANPRQGELTARATADSEALRAADEALARGQKEAEAKLVPYRASRPFMYLVRRRFGTGEAAGGAITRALDRRVAEHVKYARNRRGYDYWTRLPDVLRRKADAKRKELDAEKAELESIIRDAAERHGLPPVAEEARKIEAERGARTSSIQAADGAYADAARQLGDLSQKDPFHRKAVDELKALLQADSLASLRSRASRTPGTADDAAVSLLEAIDGELMTLKSRANELHTNGAWLASRISELRQIETRYFAPGSGSFESGFVLGALLQEFALGRRTSADLRMNIDRHYHEPERPSSIDWGSSSGSSIFGGSSGHSSDSGFHTSSSFGSGSSGSSSSGGSSSGGGFSTTDRF